MNADTIQYEVEELIDRASLTTVIDAIIQTCHEKANHLRTNWQDKNQAKTWTHDAKILNTAMEKLQN